MAILDEIRSELNDLAKGSPYVAMNGYWVCLVKLANLFPHAGGEHEQIASAIRTLSRNHTVTILANNGVDQLLNVDPPLETLLAEPRERLSALQARRELSRVSSRRTSDPKAALLALFEVLQRIRDKREHGFKSSRGPRDQEILSGAVSILKQLCEVLLKILADSLEGGIVRGRRA